MSSPILAVSMYTRVTSQCALPLLPPFSSYMSENLALFRQRSCFWAPLSLWILAVTYLDRRTQAGLCLPWVRVTHFSFAFLSGWPLPCKKRLVLTLEESHLFSNSDLYCSAKICLFSWHSKKRREGNVKVHQPWIASVLLGIYVRGWSLGLKCCPHGRAGERKMGGKSFLQQVAGRGRVIYWGGNFKMFLPNENVDALSAWTVQATNDWC